MGAPKVRCVRPSVQPQRCHLTDPKGGPAIAHSPLTRFLTKIYHPNIG
jgi:hypothetical protein